MRGIQDEKQRKNEALNPPEMKHDLLSIKKPNELVDDLARPRHRQIMPGIFERDQPRLGHERLHTGSVRVGHDGVPGAPDEEHAAAGLAGLAAERGERGREGAHGAVTDGRGDRGVVAGEMCGLDADEVGEWVVCFGGVVGEVLEVQL